MTEPVQQTTVQPGLAGRIREAIWVAVHAHTATSDDAVTATHDVISALESLGIDLHQEGDDE